MLEMISVKLVHFYLMKRIYILIDLIYFAMKKGSNPLLTHYIVYITWLDNQAVQTTGNKSYRPETNLFVEEY